MKQDLIQEQKLQQKMNHSLIQAIHMLQLSSIEMIDFIQEIANENPLIEAINFDYEFVSYRKNNQYSNPIEEMNPQELSMYDQLKQQLVSFDMDHNFKETILFGIDSLDEAGYLTVDLSLWAESCGVTLEQVEQALKIIQSLEPAGIGARSLTECIILQLRKEKQYQDYMKRLLEEKLELVAEADIPQIMEFCQITEQQALETLNAIKNCTPKPGQIFHTNTSEHIIPEANVSKDGGTFKLSFYKWASPTLTVNKEYQDIEQYGEEGSSYLKEKYKELEWLNQMIHHRSNTMELVIKKIIEKQYLFFEHGTFMLKPLTLKEIAKEIDVNISTVSRAIRNKYLQTEYGIIPLKFFLQSGVKQQNGKRTAAFTIKQLIKEIITHEDKQKPLSDEKIKNRLADEFGIKVARRTIMKYREQLQILSSSKRKKRRII